MASPDISTEDFSTAASQPERWRRPYVVYNPHEKSYGTYNLEHHTITAGQLTTRLSAESLYAVFKHEKTHAIFENVPIEQQQEIVYEVMKHPLELITFYQMLRNDLYDNYYFSREGAIGRQWDAQVAHKQLYSEIRMLENNRNYEEADISFIVDELLAFSNSSTSADDIIGRDEYLRYIIQFARNLVSFFGDETKTILKKVGIIQVDVTREVMLLSKNVAFMTDRSALQSRAS